MLHTEQVKVIMNSYNFASNMEPNQWRRVNKSSKSFVFLFSLDRLKVFQLLMENNADVNIVNDLGETTLFFVAHFGGKYNSFSDT